MTYKNKIDFLRDYGSKTTVISEIFKEDEKAGKDINETQIELLKRQIVKSKMLHSYTLKYLKLRDQIGWI